MTEVHKLQAGAAFPSLPVESPDGGRVDIAKPRFDDTDWQLVVVYRGRHCPLCTRYLNELKGYGARLRAIGVDIAAVSADSAEQLAEHLGGEQRPREKRLQVSFPLYHSLGLEQMKQLGLYISHPRSEQETDHPFAEPGLFVINGEGAVQVVDISNNPFVRPQLEHLVSGLEWIRNPDNNYPIRGTFSY